MKEKKVKDHRSGARTLTIHTTRGEQLDYERAEWLATWPSPVLLRFKYEVKGHKNLFYYDITGLPTLKEYLGMGISRSQYVSLLRSLGRLGDLCSKANLPMEILRFEPENVYVANDGMLFCCLPMVPVVQQMSVLGLLGLLADVNKVKFVLPADQELTARTMDFVRRSRVFSAFDFNEFLADNFGGGSSRSSELSSPSRDFSARSHPQQVVFDPFAADAQRSDARRQDVQGDMRRQTPASNPSFGQAAANLNSANAPVGPSGVSLPPQVAPRQIRAQVQAHDQSEVETRVQAQAQVQSRVQRQAAFGVGMPANPSSTNAGSTSSANEQTKPSLKYSASVPAQSSQPSARPNLPAVEGHEAENATNDRAGKTEASFDSGTRALSGALRPSNPGLVGADAAGNLQADNYPVALNMAAPSGMSNQAFPVNSGFSPQSAVPRSFAVVRDSDGSRLCSATTTVVIGRSKRCAARVTGNTNVSRMHASVTDLGDGRFSVADLGSANGTTVAGRVLHQGDQAQIVLGEHFSVADESLHLE
ncbi:FHA domain-containing protein [Bifidobacterium sp. ESL0769]|uniref:FHA domain-containing protein n=1 Tax=Bifidobacterium sp. ESL0769 TaxID=2983229 RepID=UPI0023F70253|nr:FHA domain-containing protein [Bifidobacterium sp. ESL0769]WEV66950.1 FHA domain-containing protein [Bifidobacterium sp. ESL0769]